MSERYYIVDTCIWRDFYENRLSKVGRPLGKYANDFFMKILKRKDKIFYSEALLWELEKGYTKDEINDLLQFLILNKTLVRIEIEKEEYKEAKTFATERNIPFVDCLNAIHARNHKAIVVSQDPHIIKELEDIAEVSRPENIN